jgi:hypothetical protein
MGWWICLIAVVGWAVATIDSGPIALVLVGALWATPVFWWGWHIAHIGIFAGPGELVVRNPFRSYRLSYDEIVDLRLRSRRDPTREEAALRSLFNRQVGVVVVKDRNRPIEMAATEWLWSGGSALSHANGRTARDVDTVRSVWLERRTPNS